MTEFENVLAQFSGRIAWNARIGVGTHVLVEFGQRVMDSEKVQGEYSLWITGAPWRLEQGNKIIAGSGQDDLHSETLECLNGDQIEKITAHRPYFDASIVWRSGKRLRVFCENTDFDTIVFFTPEKTYSFDSTGIVSVADRPSVHF